jgi:hypothetical protein
MVKILIKGMKRYHYTDKLLSHIPIKPKLKNTVYLVPPRSIRYTFQRQNNTTLFSYNIKIFDDSNILVICKENDMEKFFKNFLKKQEVNWSLLQTLYDGIEFQWYQPYWNCSETLQTMISENDAWEWYANINEPSGYIWNTFQMYYKLKT